jgi:hypothetical protein
MSSRDVSFLVWALLGVAVSAWLLATWRSGERFPTLGAVVARARANRIGRMLLVLGWMWLGWHAFAR